jgi:hypothetical protein
MDSLRRQEKHVFPSVCVWGRGEINHVAMASFRQLRTRSESRIGIEPSDSQASIANPMVVFRDLLGFHHFLDKPAEATSSLIPVSG